MSEYILELQHIVKKYPGVLALNDVSLKIKKGQILGLIGENGAGKSTLIKTCSGAVIPTSGKIIVNGKEFTHMSPQLARENGIAIIYQEFNNIKGLSAAENLFLGNPIRKGIVIDKKAMEEEAEKAFEQLNIKIDPKELCGNLSVGYQQMIEIAKAIRLDAKVLIMDEPSAPLTSKEVESMMQVCELLKSQGVAIIYISHRLEEIFRLSSEIVVLRDGEYIDTLKTEESNVDELIQLMVGRQLKESYPKKPKNIISDEIILKLEDVCGNGDRHVNLEVRKGEVLGIAGLVGAGRTELAQMIFGAVKKDSGKIYFNNKEINPKCPKDAIELGIALVPEDRKRHGAILHNSINHNINMPIYDHFSKFSKINEKIEKDTTNKQIKELLVKTPSINQLVKNLSGGNQQKVILGKWLAANSQLIILDEPTRGIDVGAKFEIYKIINTLVEKGKTVILISSEMEELIGMSDRIIVFSEGCITGELQKDEFSQNAIMGLAANC
ncbi:MAG: sugar ABC transporter ATP-binding protein [Sphaerochaetaceae bacterium]|nr:sugar ABC transporter ATP-binding protein [Sphaerochaetaceae bacterium]MDC7236453.1 sugar ABC transporter ATP-binding protein [Sphaerochaetaceae bacterium]MDC7251116.1 sugar ABC transporter ATP-binding protein [Sphaerochaetaceae bacterium]